MFIKKLPDWLVASFRVALLGEIYPNIRAVAVGYDGDSQLCIRYYLDREETDFDIESIEVMATNLETTITEKIITNINLKGMFASGLQRNLEALSGFVYARREYC